MSRHRTPVTERAWFQWAFILGGVVLATALSWGAVAIYFGPSIR